MGVGDEEVKTQRCRIEDIIYHVGTPHHMLEEKPGTERGKEGNKGAQRKIAQNK
jgi:hypothetical protein